MRAAPVLTELFGIPITTLHVFLQRLDAARVLLDQLLVVLLELLLLILLLDQLLVVLLELLLVLLLRQYLAGEPPTGTFELLRKCGLS